MNFETLIKKLKKLGYELQVEKDGNKKEINLETENVTGYFLKDWKMVNYKDKNILRWTIRSKEQHIVSMSGDTIQGFYDVFFELSKKEKTLGEILSKKEIKDLMKEIKRIDIEITSLQMRKTISEGLLKSYRDEERDRKKEKKIINELQNKITKMKEELKIIRRS